MNVDEIQTKAAEIRFVRVVLTVLAWPVYAIGFLIAAVWVAVTWLLAAGRVGFDDARSRFGGGD